MNKLIPEDSYLIEAYLLGQLPEDEIQKLEERQENEPQLKHRIEEYRELMEAVNETEILEFRRRLAEVGQEISGSASSTGKVLSLKRTQWWYAMAAAVAIIFAVVLLNRSPNYADQYYSTYPLGKEVRDDTLLALTVWETAYQQGNYQQALDGLIQAFGEKPELRDSLLFFAASANLELGRNAEAIKQMETIINHPGFHYQEEARWYLAMAWLKEGKTDQAMVYLKQIAASEGPHFNKTRAKELLKKMK